MSKLKYGMAAASAIAAFVGAAGLSLSPALAGEQMGSQASSFTERAKNGYVIQMQECNTLKNSQPEAYEPCVEKARATRDNLLTQTEGSADARQGSQGFGSNQSQQQFSGQKQGPIDKMTSAVKETVAELFGSSDQGRESQQPSAGQHQGQGSGQGSAQGQQPSQQGFGAGQAMQGQDFAQQSFGAGSGGQNFGPQGSSTQGQQFQGQQGQSGQGSFQGGNYGQQSQGQQPQGQQPQGQSWQQGSGGTNQQFQSGGTQGFHGSSNPQGRSMSGSGGAQGENEYAIQMQECKTLKNSQPDAYEPCLQKAQSMRDKGSQHSDQQFSGQKQGPIDKMTSAVKETVAEVKEKLFGSSDQGREGSQGQSMGQGQQQGGVAQGPNPLQQGFEARHLGAAGGQGGQNFGQQGPTQGQQSGQGSFQGGNFGQQQPQGQSWQQGTGSTNQQSPGQQGQSGQGQGSFQGGGQQSQGQPCPQGTSGTSQQFQTGGTQGSTNQQGGPTSGSAGGARGEHMDPVEYYQALARQQYATLNQECKTLKQDPNVYEQCQKHAESVRDKIAGMAEQGT